MVVAKKFFSLAFLMFLGACGGLNVEKITLKDPVATPLDAQPSPIGFHEVRWAIPTGTPVLSQSPQGIFGLLSCERPYGMMERGISSREIPDDIFKDIFFTTLTAQKYDVTGDPGRFFDEEEDALRTIYAVGARITDMKADTCLRERWGSTMGVKGEAEMTVEWSVYDLLHRKTVMKTTTKGYGNLIHPNYEGVTLLVEEAFAAAVHNLGADPAFNDLVFNGRMPPQDSREIRRNLDIMDDPVTKFDPQESVTIAPAPLLRMPAKTQMDEIIKTAVMVEVGGAHGSGFFITDMGHILTNAHVVGNAVRVRVVSAGQQDKMTAEVLRVDRLRDVALLRLEVIPENLNVQLLPIHAEKPPIGTDVYAIGAPRLRKLQDTVTKGIVSAHRYDRREKQWYIQSDVDIYGGNSGGPLIDEYGNIVGISVSGYYVAADTMGGLNHFIPIADALAALNIGY